MFRNNTVVRNTVIYVQYDISKFTYFSSKLVEYKIYFFSPYIHTFIRTYSYVRGHNQFAKNKET